MLPRRPLQASLPLAVLAITVLGACSTTANVSDVYMGLDSPGGNGETRRRSVFFTDTKEIHCIAQAGIGRPGVTVEAFLRQTVAYDYLADAFVPTDRIVAYTEFKPEPNGAPVYIDVELERVENESEDETQGESAASGSADELPYPVGSYVCEITLDGELQGTANFNIDFPPCPPVALVPNGTCFGFFKERTTCPRYGLPSGDPATCTCSITSGWECN